jgi:hypothetical protein
MVSRNKQLAHSTILLSIIKSIRWNSKIGAFFIILFSLDFVFFGSLQIENDEEEDVGRFSRTFRRNSSWLHLFVLFVFFLSFNKIKNLIKPVKVQTLVIRIATQPLATPIPFYVFALVFISLSKLIRLEFYVLDRWIRIYAFGGALYMILPHTFPWCNSEEELHMNASVNSGICSIVARNLSKKRMRMNI